MDKMLSFAGAQQGKKYVYLSEGPITFDSSGFVCYVLRYMGLNASNLSAASLSTVDKWVKISDLDALLPGDLLFFNASESQKISHSGIFLGGDQFIHASSSAGCVKVSRLSGHYAGSFVTARRIF